MSGCVTDYHFRRLKALYGNLIGDDISDLKEDCSGGQCEIRSNKMGYNIAYCDSSCRSYHYGNPIRDLAMTDRFQQCGSQWLTEEYDGLERNCVPTPKEWADVLDAFTTLSKLERDCPGCLEMMGKLIKGSPPFNYGNTSDNVKRFLLTRRD